jgi:AbiJ N-terminal domain 4
MAHGSSGGTTLALAMAAKPGNQDGMISDPSAPFSKRFGFTTEAPITVRTDAPPDFRRAVISLGSHYMLGGTEMARVVRQVLAHHRLRSDYFLTNDTRKIEDLVEQCAWYRIYEVAEAIYTNLKRDPSALLLRKAERFEAEINDYCRAHGIGWRMVAGRFEARGPEVQDFLEKRVENNLRIAKKNTSAEELRKAIEDLSRRPRPDVTGAVQHVGAALECLARDVCGDPKLSLGDIIKEHPSLFPGPYRKIAEGIWGIVSNKGRHLREGGEPTFDEAMVLVGLVSAMCTYLLREKADGGGP